MKVAYFISLSRSISFYVIPKKRLLFYAGSLMKMKKILIYVDQFMII